MEKNEEVKILGISLLYIIVISIFSLFNRITPFIVAQNGLKKELSLFLHRNILWIMVVVGIILVLSILIKKIYQNSYSNILHNTVICIVVGTLVALEGIINLASSLPIRIMSIQTSLKTLPQFETNIEGLLIRNIISNIISVLIILGQILFGVYLIKSRKGKPN